MPQFSGRSERTVAPGKPHLGVLDPARFGGQLLLVGNRYKNNGLGAALDDDRGLLAGLDGLVQILEDGEDGLLEAGTTRITSISAGGMTPVCSLYTMEKPWEK